MIKLFDILKATDGVYGTRFSGSGFKGCCIALMNPKKANSVLEKVEKKYKDAFPKFKNKYSAHICQTADGVKL